MEGLSPMESGVPKHLEPEARHLCDHFSRHAAFLCGCGGTSHYPAASYLDHDHAQQGAAEAQWGDAGAAGAHPAQAWS